MRGNEGGHPGSRDTDTHFRLYNSVCTLLPSFTGPDHLCLYVVLRAWVLLQ